LYADTFDIIIQYTYFIASNDSINETGFELTQTILKLVTSITEMIAEVRKTT